MLLYFLICKVFFLNGVVGYYTSTTLNLPRVLLYQEKGIQIHRFIKLGLSCLLLWFGGSTGHETTVELR